MATENNEDFSLADLDAKTAKQLADLAGVSQSYVEKAKEICSFRLAHLVINGELKFGPAYRRLTDLREAGLVQELQSGAVDFDTAWLRAREILSAGRGTKRRRNLTKRNLADQIKELESEIDTLRRQLNISGSDRTSRSLESED